MEYPMFIGGRPVTTAEPRPVELPFDGSEVGTVYQATKEQVDAAIAAAAAAALLMGEMTLDERSTILRKSYQRLMDDRDEMALAVSSETGKPLKEARLEVDRAALTLLFSAEEAHRLHGEVVPMDASPAGKGRWAMTVREPLGVIAAITPFNFPLNLAMHKIGPALAGGNAVVHKPASTTPISAIRMAHLFTECGLPAGALNVVTGPGGAIGDQLVFDKRVAMVTFTGSPEVGLRIRNLAGLKRVTLELGSNSAVIVEEDANLDEAVARSVAGSFAHSGQVCISVQRIFVHRKIRNEFLERCVEGARKLAIGHPHSPQTDISSLITAGEAERVAGWIQEAVDAGARVATGGHRLHRATIEPTILTEVPATASLSCREAFGPVVGVNVYDSLDEAIARVNDSEYGLQAGIYTRDIQKAFYAARRVHVGGFLINEVPQYRVDQMPYGGVKLSGAGREGPKYAIEEMTEPKLVCWKV
ncbi:MAG: aldehyde dehydrogenase family protein [Acidobacteria bacterium]|nr:aldehyde dehydrogenase family protein [Acidobacteriota bacterium]MBI3471763.1 aldehyde dehydrogenase family protein [Candidatus Solibacter usitatus]